MLDGKNSGTKAWKASCVSGVKCRYAKRWVCILFVKKWCMANQKGSRKIFGKAKKFVTNGK